MALLDVEITTPPAVAIQTVFAHGKTVAVPPGATVRVQVTGDELGRVQAVMQAGIRQAKKEGALDSEVAGGGVKVLTAGYGDAPVGSKKHRLAHPDQYEADGSLKATKPAKKDEAPTKKDEAPTKKDEAPTKKDEAPTKKDEKPAK
jgi:hypothetical protein